MLPVLAGSEDSAVQQAGSLVTPDSLRFDFTFPRPLTMTELAAVEDWVNTVALAGQAVTVSSMPLKQAQESGSIALFGQKYNADAVRVVRMGAPFPAAAINNTAGYDGVNTSDARSSTCTATDNNKRAAAAAAAATMPLSQELCGGTHVANTSAIYPFRIAAETGVSSGTRRIEAVAGPAAAAALLATARAVSTMNPALRLHPSAPAAETEAAVAKLRGRHDALAKQVKELQEQVQKLRLAGAAGAGGASASSAAAASGVSCDASGCFEWLTLPGWSVHALPVTIMAEDGVQDALAALCASSVCTGADASASAAESVVPGAESNAESSAEAEAEAEKVLAYIWQLRRAQNNANASSSSDSTTITSDSSSSSSTSAASDATAAVNAPSEGEVEDDHQAVVIYGVPAADCADYATFRALTTDIAQRQWAAARAAGVAGSLVHVFVGETGRTSVILSHKEVELAEQAKKDKKAAANSKSNGGKGVKKGGAATPVATETAATPAPAPAESQSGDGVLSEIRADVRDRVRLALSQDPDAELRGTVRGAVRDAVRDAVREKVRSRCAELRLSVRHVWGAIEVALPGTKGSAGDASAQGVVGLTALANGGANSNASGNARGAASASDGTTASSALARSVAKRIVLGLRQVKRDKEMKEKASKDKSDSAI